MSEYVGINHTFENQKEMIIISRTLTAACRRICAIQYFKVRRISKFAFTIGTNIPLCFVDDHFVDNFPSNDRVLGEQRQLHSFKVLQTAPGN
jgi:hypothetical protein